MMLYYIQAKVAPTIFTGDCAIWWKPDRCGYTTDLKKAGVYTSEEVKTLPRPDDVPRNKDLVDEASVSHCTLSALDGYRGDG